MRIKKLLEQKPKFFYDKWIFWKTLKAGQKILFYNYRLRLFMGMLKSK